MRRLAMLCLLLSGVPAAGQVDAPWRAAPGYLAPFAPADGRAAAYRAYVSPLDLDAALRALEADGSLIRAPGAWQAWPLPPADAFGQAGRYDRWALARLYGARQPRVARGSRAERGRVVETWTLISPYPDAAQRELDPVWWTLFERRIRCPEWDQAKPEDGRADSSPKSSWPAPSGWSWMRARRSARSPANWI